MYKCTNSVQPRKQGAIMKKVLTVFIAVILVALTAFWCVACDEKTATQAKGSSISYSSAIQSLRR